MMAFWTALRSAVLHMVALLSNEPGREFFRPSGMFFVKSLIQMIRFIARFRPFRDVLIF